MLSAFVPVPTGLRGRYCLRLVVAVAVEMGTVRRRRSAMLHGVSRVTVVPVVNTGTSK